MTNSQERRPRPARFVFTRATGWEPDYVVSNREGMAAGYRGPFPSEGPGAARLPGLIKTFCRNRSEAETLASQLRTSDRVAILWRRDKPVGVVGATSVAQGSYSGWHFTVGSVSAEARGSDLLRRMIETVLSQEPVDFVSSSTTKTDRAIPLDLLRRLSPTHSASEDPDVLTAWGLGALCTQVRCGPRRVAASDLSGRLTTSAGLTAPTTVSSTVSSAETATATIASRPTTERQPTTGSLLKIAVTGTNGKTSCVELGRQLMNACGQEAASFGTLGVTTSRGRNKDGRIGPGPNGLPRLAKRLWALGVQSLWAEAFSNALRKGLLDQLPVDVAIFTQLGVDHISVHGSLAGYWAAKERLFTTVLSDDGVVVLNPSANGADRILAIAEAREVRVVTTGPGNMIELGDGFLSLEGERFETQLPFLEEVMVRNLELVIGASLQAGVDPANIARNLSCLTFPPGRFMEVEVDAEYQLVIEAAHNGDALEVSLNHWRQQTSGRLLVLLASVGSSDEERWEPLGEVADVLGDVIVVTDESPYGNHAEKIRSALLRGSPRAIEIPDRVEAIGWLLDHAEPGDVVMLMGRADEAFVVGRAGSVAFPSDESLVRSHLAGSQSLIAG